ncbi:HAD family hydrolase [Sporolactobacillus shoreae]|uniref:HAD family hydrolase n=1 Tax=Sporolactobacillus shoreae TaxID=1465501 RepID=A0A4Z0GM99_9BACL|nr:HAD hydrolase-like protein [Sporolactobacillus shoreae]TGA97214.1 HAD family hydrolase [Sporolactobacillus shoreae]
MLKTILFDVDGVFLSEERYFDASALTVWELLTSENYLGLGGEKDFRTVYSDQEIANLRAKVFLNDQVLNFMKSRGMNANWDMIYVTFSVQLIHLVSQLPDSVRKEAADLLQGTISRETLDEFRSLFRKYPVKPDFDRFPDDFSETDATRQGLILYLNELAGKRLGIQTDQFRPKSTLWHIGEHASQEWYIGDEYVLSSTGLPSVQTGKKGFMNEEVTLADPKLIRNMFRELIQKGVNIGIATGRPHLETYKPFGYLNWLELLDENHIATADEVLAAEKKYDAAPLAKPHPFTYLLSYHGKDSDERRWTSREPEKLPNGSETLIVGDSLADLLCAKQLGCRFAGVLTGLSGKKARGELEAHGADFILDSIADIKDLALELIEK